MRECALDVTRAVFAEDSAYAQRSSVCRQWHSGARCAEVLEAARVASECEYERGEKSSERVERGVKNQNIYRSIHPRRYARSRDRASAQNHFARAPCGALSTEFFATMICNGAKAQNDPSLTEPNDARTSRDIAEPDALRCCDLVGDERDRRIEYSPPPGNVRV